MADYLYLTGNVFINFLPYHPVKLDQNDVNPANGAIQSTAYHIFFTSGRFEYPRTKSTRYIFHVLSLKD